MVLVSGVGLGLDTAGLGLGLSLGLPGLGLGLGLGLSGLGLVLVSDSLVLITSLTRSICATGTSLHLSRNYHCLTTR